MSDVRQWTRWLALLFVASEVHSVSAQAECPIAVRVTAVVEESIYIDKGWRQGVEEEDEVLFDAGNGATICAQVQSVFGDEARCVAAAGSSPATAGMTGKIVSPLRPPLAQPSVPLAGSPLTAAVGQETDGLAPASAQSEPAPGAVQRVAVRVTASSGGSVYLDQGRMAGVRPGDEVVLYPPGDGIVNATIQSVSRNTSRCVLIAGERRIDIGTRGEILVPSGRRTEPAEELPPGRGAPEHPPWAQPPEEWNDSQPLLAPAFSRAPEERPRQLHGRAYAQYLHTWNNNADSNQYSLGRIGAALWVDNPFCRGDGLHIAGEFNERGVFLEDDFDDVLGPGRIDRFSYYWGGSDDRPLRVEFGRFLSNEMPEFGILDGTEVIYRTAAGHRLGVSVGLLPEPFPNLGVIGDWQMSAFYHWAADDSEFLASRLGVQKTWHQGTPDRDLAIWSVDYDPNPFFSLHGTAWGDFYDAHDNLKTTSFEISEAVLQPLVRIDPGHGFGATASYVRWPQLRRLDYSPFVQNQIVGDWVLRYGIFTWQEVGQRIRLDGRVDRWDDQSRQSGTTWEGRVAFRELLVPSGEIAIAVFGTHGAFSSGPGGRISISRQFPRCFALVEYGIADYKFTSAAGGTTFGASPTNLVQQSARVNLDFSISTDKSVSVFADYRFGQHQDAVQAGVFFQKRL